MPPLPPLKCLRFFEAAARRESFAGAAVELRVTRSAVAHRVKVLEAHIGGEAAETGVDRVGGGEVAHAEAL